MGSSRLSWSSRTAGRVSSWRWAARYSNDSSHVAVEIHSRSRSAARPRCPAPPAPDQPSASIASVRARSSPIDGLSGRSPADASHDWQVVAAGGRPHPRVLRLHVSDQDLVIRTTGNFAGPLRPKPSPGRVLGGAQLRGGLGERAVVHAAVQGAEQHHRLYPLGGDGLTERLGVSPWPSTPATLRDRGWRGVIES